MIFATFIKQKRISLRLTLRAFCRQHNFDPGYVSKLERGRISAPRKAKTLDRYIVALELDEAERREFVALAAISAGRIPEPLTEAEFVKMLPVLFEMAGASEDDLRKFVEWLRERGVMPFALIEGKIVEGDVIPSSLAAIGECLFEPKDNPEPQWIIKPSIIFHTYKQAGDAWKEMVKFMRARGRQFPIEWGVEL